MIQIVNALHQAVGIDIVIVGTDFDVSSRQNDIAVVDRVDNIHYAQLPGEQLVGIDIDHRLPILAAERRRNFRTLDHGDLVANAKLRQIVKLGFVETLALDGDKAHGKTRRIELQHNGRQSAGRKTLQIGECEIG